MAQENMLNQRDRMRALGGRCRRRTGAVLVVLLRADSSGAQDTRRGGIAGGWRRRWYAQLQITSNSALQAARWTSLQV